MCSGSEAGSYLRLIGVSLVVWSCAAEAAVPRSASACDRHQRLYRGTSLIRKRTLLGPSLIRNSAPLGPYSRTAVLRSASACDCATTDTSACMDGVWG